MIANLVLHLPRCQKEGEAGNMKCVDDGMWVEQLCVSRVCLLHA
jgi:hypothetical protein